ncbi:MAG: ketoacyl-ACP synthase III [Lentisphaeria bacterium]|nr:ketoacyl-ACP synthase III [Lentisphaeria bacterium]
MAVKIAGIGSYVPEKILTNFDLEKMVDTSDEWITSRTGIRVRHISEPEVPTSDLALNAAKRAMEMAGITAEQLDIISVATITGDYHFPSTACVLQDKLGATSNCACYDLQAACSGLIYSNDVATAMLKHRKHAKYALVVGAEKLSGVVDWTDRSTCVLFGDGASALVLVKDDDDQGDDTLLTTVLGAKGGNAQILKIPAGGSVLPASHETIDNKQHFIQMGGPEVFKLAVTAMASASKAALAEFNLTVDQLRWVIPHQANKRIIDAVCSRLGATEEQVYVNVDRYGNTSAASIGICLDEIVRGGMIKPGDYVLLTSFGAGMTWGAALLRWK